MRCTPSLPQYFVVTTARCSAVGLKSGISCVRRWTGAWFNGLILSAVFAASTSASFGSDFGWQTMYSGI